MFTGRPTHGWSDRRRLKGHHALAIGCAEGAGTGAFAHGVTQRSAVGARLFESGIETNIGVLHESGHEAPWIVAMDCVPSAAAVHDYGLH